METFEEHYASMMDTIRKRHPLADEVHHGGLGFFKGGHESGSAHV